MHPPGLQDPHRGQVVLLALTRYLTVDKDTHKPILETLGWQLLSNPEAILRRVYRSAASTLAGQQRERYKGTWVADAKLGTTPFRSVPPHDTSPMPPPSPQPTTNIDDC